MLCSVRNLAGSIAALTAGYCSVTALIKSAIRICAVKRCAVRACGMITLVIGGIMSYEISFAAARARIACSVQCCGVPESRAFFCAADTACLR